MTDENLLIDLEAALKHLVEAESQNSNKHKEVKKWFEDNFGETGRASYVTESKQAYNRPGEQFKHKDPHVIFVYKDDETLKVLLTTIPKGVYPELRTVLFVKKDAANKFDTTFIMTQGVDSKVKSFYEKAFPEAEKIVTSSKSSSATASVSLDAGNAVLLQVRALIESGKFSCVTLVGPPGTSKSWYAEKIGLELVEGDKTRIRFVQFHPSYQYEDFIEGFVPKEDGGFESKPKHLLEMCQIAEENPDKTCVLIIDEISRTDPSRVFGEALTYVETTKRGKKFHLASGREISIPANLILLATMNQFDKGVDEVDSALERRFAKISLDPNKDYLKQFLEANKMSQALIERVLVFFGIVNGTKNPNCKIGHAYFLNSKDEASLKQLWDHQLKFQFEKYFRLDPSSFSEIEKAWNRIFEGASLTANTEPVVVP